MYYKNISTDNDMSRLIRFVSERIPRYLKFSPAPYKKICRV